MRKILYIIAVMALAAWFKYGTDDIHSDIAEEKKCMADAQTGNEVKRCFDMIDAHMGKNSAQ